ncbi:MAG: S8 family serine peptidase, partial [Candidatus Hydrogenedentota bacterium]
IALVLLSVSFAAAAANDLAEPPNYVRGHGGLMQPLTMSTEEVGVLFDEGYTRRERERALAPLRNVRGMPDGELAHHLRDRWSVVRLEENLTRAGARQAMGELRAHRAIRRVSPVYRANGWADGLLLEYLTVSFYTHEMDEARRESLLGEYPVDVDAVHQFPEIGRVVYRLRVQDDTELDALSIANELAETPGVRGATPEFAHNYRQLNSVRYEPNDPMFGHMDLDAYGQSIRQYNQQELSRTWYLDYLRAPEAWALFGDQPGDVGHEDVVIAVLDTGVEKNHPAVDANLLRDAEGDVIGYNFLDAEKEWYDVQDQPHGTSQAGVIASVGDNNQGIPGLTWNSRILPVRVSTEHHDNWPELDEGFNKNIADAVKWVSGQPVDDVEPAEITADIINFGWTTVFPDVQLEDAVATAHAKGVILTMGAGNRNYSLTSHFEYPQVYPEVITAGTVNYRRQRSNETDWLGGMGAKYPVSGSNWGWCVNLVTPSGSATNPPNFGHDDRYRYSDAGYTDWPPCNLDQTFDPEVWSIWGADLTVEGEGVNNTTCTAPSVWDKAYFGNIGGTSMAMPMLSGAAALMLSYAIENDRDLTPGQVQAALQFTADEDVWQSRDANDPAVGGQPQIIGRNVYTGYGLLDIYSALRWAIDAPYWQADDFSDDWEHRMSVRGAYNRNPETPTELTGGGDVVLHGDLVENATAAELEAEDQWDYSVYFNRQIDGETVARLDLDGNLYIAGELHKETYVGTGPAATVTNFSTNPAVYETIAHTEVEVPWRVVHTGEGQGYLLLDAYGNLEITGRVFRGANPDPVNWFVRENWRDENEGEFPGEDSDWIVWSGEWEIEVLNEDEDEVIYPDNHVLTKKSDSTANIAIPQDSADGVRFIRFRRTEGNGEVALNLRNHAGNWLSVSIRYSTSQEADMIYLHEYVDGQYNLLGETQVKYFDYDNNNSELVVKEGITDDKWYNVRAWVSGDEVWVFFGPDGTEDGGRATGTNYLEFPGAEPLLAPAFYSSPPDSDIQAATVAPTSLLETAHFNIWMDGEPANPTNYQFDRIFVLNYGPEEGGYGEHYHWY